MRPMCSPFMSSLIYWCHKSYGVASIMEPPASWFHPGHFIINNPPPRFLASIEFKRNVSVLIVRNKRHLMIIIYTPNSSKIEWRPCNRSYPARDSNKSLNIYSFLFTHILYWNIVYNYLYKFRVCVIPKKHLSPMWVCRLLMLFSYQGLTYPQTGSYIGGSLVRTLIHDDLLMFECLNPIKGGTLNARK